MLLSFSDRRVLMIEFVFAVSSAVSDAEAAQFDKHE